MSTVTKTHTQPARPTKAKSAANNAAQAKVGSQNKHLSLDKKKESGSEEKLENDEVDEEKSDEVDEEKSDEAHEEESDEVDEEESDEKDGKSTDDNDESYSETAAEALERVGTLTGTEGTPVNTIPTSAEKQQKTHVLVESPADKTPEVSPKRAKEIEEDLARVGTLAGTEGTPV